MQMMRHRLNSCALAFALLFLFDAGGSPSLAAAATPVFRPIDSSYAIAFSDGFNAGILDTTKWQANWLGCSTCITPPVQPDNELAAYDPKQVTVRNGKAELALISDAVTVNGIRYPYRSGMIQSNKKFSFVYGYVEARIYLPLSGETNKIANWPAFWTNGQNWPNDGENDVMEGLSGGDPCYHFHSAKGSHGDCKEGSFSGWHVYGSLWEPGKISYYYDGIKVGQITSGVTSSPMYLILNYGISSEHGGEHRVPATMRVDHVRVWQKQ